METSFTLRILSACRGFGWTNATAKRRRCSRSCTPTESDSLIRIGMFDCFGMSDIGRVRERNEDQFLIADLARSVGTCPVMSSLCEAWDPGAVSRANLLIVADGVGGNAGGERASQLATEEIVEYLHCNRHRLERHAECGGDLILEDLKSALIWARQRIQEEAAALPEFCRMGTTLTLAYLQWPTAYLTHVGDSRAYLYRSHELIQITHDQTMAQMLADAGVIASECVDSHPLRNTLGSVLCHDAGQLLPRVYQQGLAAGDQLLLCTDGLTKRVLPAQIAEILDSTFTAEDACRELVAAANIAGGPDNTTVVLARFGHREAPDDDTPTVEMKLPSRLT